MTGTARTTSPATRRRRARPLALLLSAAALASATSLAWGPGPAQADPGDTVVALGSSRLLQSEDLASVQVPLDTGSVVLGRDDPFSGCIGEDRWSDVLRGAGKPVTAAWTSRRNPDEALYESVGQTTTSTRAKKYAATLVRSGIRACQGPTTPYDFHYGPSTSARVGSGYATWAPFYRGDARQPDGGVIVIGKGTRFGIVEVHGSWGPTDQTLESVAKVAVNRLT